MSKILLSSDGNSHRITLDNPPLNILDLEMLAELRDTIGSLAEDRHALVLDASGSRAFSAGASVQDHLGDRVEAMLELFHDCFRILAGLDLVTVSLVRGAALGGGCELALACDLVLASDSASFGVPEINLGVFPPVAVWQLSRLTSPKRGLEMILTGEPIDPFEAERRGLVNAVFPSTEFDARAAAWLERIYRQSSSSLRMAKKAFRIAGPSGFNQTLGEVERLYLDELMKTHDATEGLSAFIEKRPARWEGR